MRHYCLIIFEGNMKKLLVTLFAVLSFSAWAQKPENITMVISASASQSSTPLVLKLLDKANLIQSKYFFAPEFKPGGNGVLGLKYMDASPQDRIAGIAPAFIENAKSGNLPAVSFNRSGGIGLVNVRQRLQLLYPDRYHLEIKDEPNLYRVSLYLDLVKI